MSDSTALVRIVGGLAGAQLGDDADARLLRLLSRSIPVRVTAHGWDVDADLDLLAAALAEHDPESICFSPAIPVDVALTLTRRVLAASPTTDVVVCATPTPELWAQAARTGIRDIVEPAGGLDELAVALVEAVGRANRVREHVSRTEGPGAREARVIVVLSPKGGSGKTLVAVNLAAALARKAAGRVALVDFDCQFGDVATGLGLEPDRTLTELAAVPQLDGPTMKLFLVQHRDSSVFVLPSSGQPDEADIVDEETSSTILHLVQDEFDYVVVDTAAGIDERTLAAVHAATDLVLVASMDVTSVRNMVKELTILDQLGIVRPARHFVVNRVDPRSGIKIDDIEAAVGMSAAYQIETSPTVLASMNRGRPVVLSEPSSGPAKVFRELADVLLDTRTGSPSGSDAKPHRSLFRRRS